MVFRGTWSVLIGVGLLGTLACAEMALAQSQPPVQAVSPNVLHADARVAATDDGREQQQREREQQEQRRATVDVRRAAERAALSDKRTKAILGDGQLRVASSDVEIDKGEAESFLEGTSGRRPSSRVIVVALNLQTNIAARAVVAVPHYRVLAVERVAADAMPLVRADADDALALAKTSPAVRQAVGETLGLYRILDPGSEERIPFAAGVLPLGGSSPDDPCGVDRCLTLSFRTENGYLPLLVHIDLTRRTVTVDSGGQFR